MKNYVIIFLLLLINGISIAQVNWKLDYNSANFAFLKVDYTTYNFEGGYFAKFGYHPGHDIYEIPFDIIYNPPFDFGDITFKYSGTGDSIFAATIVWAGRGHITYPDSISGSNEFSVDSSINVIPYSFQYYNYIGEIKDSIFRQKADSAWLSVKNLSVVKRFGEEGNVFRVGLYLYTPSVGAFDPYTAKWIVFLYRGQLLLNVGDDVNKPESYRLLQNYPNPFNPLTTIQYAIGKRQFVSLKVYDISGREVAALVNEIKNPGTYVVDFNGSKLSSGIYFYRLETGSFIQTKKMILLK